jgi:hypothetical protein
VTLRGVRASSGPITDALERGSAATVWPLHVLKLASATSVRALDVRQLPLRITRAASIRPLGVRHLALQVAGAIRVRSLGIRQLALRAARAASSR